MSAKLIRSSSSLKLASVVTRAAIIITIGVFTAGFTGMAVAQTVEDSASVYEFVEAYQQTFRTHDPAALAEFFTEDADIIMFNLPEIRGRQTIENVWRDYWQSKFNKQEPERKGTFTLNSVRFLARDVAMVNIETKTGGRDSMGVELNVRRARGTWVILKQNGKWLIVAMRGMPTEEDQIIRSIVKPEIKVDGTFKPIGPPLVTPSRTDLGKNCIVELKQQYKISGILSGSLEIDFRILVNGPCGEPPGTYEEEWIAFGSFSGTVDSRPAKGKFNYTAKVKAGGDVEGTIVFGQGFNGEIIVKGNIKEGNLSYISHLDETNVKD